MSEGKSNANWNCIVIAARSLLLVYLLYTVRPVTAYEGKLEIEGKPEVSKSANLPPVEAGHRFHQQRRFKWRVSGRSVRERRGTSTSMRRERRSRPN